EEVLVGGRLLVGDASVAGGEPDERILGGGPGSGEDFRGNGGWHGVPFLGLRGLGAKSRGEGSRGGDSSHTRPEGAALRPRQFCQGPQGLRGGCTRCGW